MVLKRQSWPRLDSFSGGTGRIHLDTLDLLRPLSSQEKKKDIIDMNDMIKEKVHDTISDVLGAWNLLHFFDRKRDSSFGDHGLLHSWNTV